MIRLPVVISTPPDAAGAFAPFLHGEAFADPEKMLFNERVPAFSMSIARAHEIGSDVPFTVRANFGTVRVASWFGARVRQADDNPAWIWHRPGEEIALEDIAPRAPRAG